MARPQSSLARIPKEESRHKIITWEILGQIFDIVGVYKFLAPFNFWTAFNLSVWCVLAQLLMSTRLSSPGFLTRVELEEEQ